MGMIKKSITVTEQQDAWLRSQLAKGDYASDSELLRELIRERQMQQQDTTREREAIRAALVEGERSGVSSQTIDEIWEQARRAHRQAHG